MCCNFIVIKYRIFIAPCSRNIWLNINYNQAFIFCGMMAFRCFYKYIVTSWLLQSGMSF